MDFMGRLGRAHDIHTTSYLIAMAQRRSIYPVLILVLLVEGISTTMARGQSSSETNPPLSAADTTQLESKYTTLNDLVVSANWVYRKEGNLVVNVAQIPNVKQLRTDQVLKQIPGVIKLEGGAYSLNGKSATIYINGVKQRITAGSLEAFLSSLPATAVSSIELVSINTGQYSADTEAVIDIKTRPNMPLGYSLQPSLSASAYRHGLRDFGSSLFYMVKMNRLLFHNTFSYNNNRMYSQQIDGLLIGGRRVLESERLQQGRTHVFTYQASLNYQLPSGRSLDLNAFVYDDFAKPKTEWSTPARQGTELRRERSDLYNIAVTYRIPSTERRFHGSVSYSISYGGIHSKTDYLDDQERLSSKAILDMEGWMQTLRASLASSLGPWQLNYGIQIDHNSIWDRSDYRTPTIATGRERTLFTGFELLPALYAQARYKFGDRVSLRAGVRLEHTHYQYILGEKEEVKQFTNLFPSLLFYYDSPNYNLSTGLISNIVRPNYEWMLPGERRVNNYISFVGRPDIKPVNAYGLVLNNTLFRYAQLNLSCHFFENYSGSVYTLEDGRLRHSVDNIADKRSYRANIVLPFALFKRKLTGQLQANVAYEQLINLRNGFTPPAGRATDYWVHNYSMFVRYAPTDRLSLSVMGRFFPNYSVTLESHPWRTRWEVDLEYSFPKEKNLTLYLSSYGLFDRDSWSTSYFLRGRYTRGVMYQGATVNLGLRLRLNKGQRVVEEYRDYRPDASRMR